MTSIRGVKDRRFQFVQLLNAMFEDEKISLKAKGFIGYCLMKTSDWKFNIEQLAIVLKEGKAAIYATIKECIENGYAIRYQPRDEKGKSMPVEFVISDSKVEIALLKKELEQEGHFKNCLPLRGFREADFREADTQGETTGENQPERILYSNTDNTNTCSSGGGAATAAGEKAPEKRIIMKHKTRNIIAKPEVEVIAYLKEKGYTDPEIHAAIKEALEINPQIKSNSPLAIERYVASIVEVKRKQPQPQQNQQDGHYAKRNDLSRNQRALQRSTEYFKELARNQHKAES